MYTVVGDGCDNPTGITTSSSSWRLLQWILPAVLRYSIDKRNFNFALTVYAPSLLKLDSPLSSVKLQSASVWSCSM